MNLYASTGEFKCHIGYIVRRLMYTNGALKVSVSYAFSLSGLARENVFVSSLETSDGHSPVTAGCKCNRKDRVLLENTVEL